ncbi:MAG: phosphoribosylglycinamide formyltransferase [Acetobacteraceae bacterium]
MRRRTAILISGRGSNMAALVRAAADPSYPAEISLVISNRADAPGLVLARRAGIPTSVIEHGGKDRTVHEAEIDTELQRRQIELVCLAGYLRVLTSFLVKRWRGRILNIHPSLLPAFPGLETHARALAAGVKLHGCTVHLVTEHLDDGPILAQAAVPVLPGDDAARLAERVLAQEHRLYPLGLAVLAGATAPAAPGEAVLLNPLPLLAATP